MAAKVVCFIPCCNAKTASGKLESNNPIWSSESTSITTIKLESGQQEMKHCIESSSTLTSALHIYQGHFLRL